jgi:CheY-like chemotaxis protein
MSADDAAAPAAILLVEDEFLVRLFAIDALEDAGFRVLPAETGAQALQVLRDAPGVRAAVIDMGLPDRPGDQLVAEFRRCRVADRHRQRPADGVAGAVLPTSRVTILVCRTAQLLLTLAKSASCPTVQ